MPYIYAAQVIPHKLVIDLPLIGNRMLNGLLCNLAHTGNFKYFLPVVWIYFRIYKQIYPKIIKNAVSLNVSKVVQGGSWMRKT